MTPEELKKDIAKGRPDRCLAFFTSASDAERRKLAKDVLSLYRELATDITGFGDTQDRWYDDRSVSYEKKLAVASIAVFATVTLSELKSLRGRGSLNHTYTFEVLSARRPDWLSEWTEWTLEGGLVPQWGRTDTNWHAVRKLVREGLCPAPSTDGYIHCAIAVAGFACETRLGHPNKSVKDWLLDDPGLLENEVWRVFEVEGTTAASLAGADKYIHSGFGWLDALRELCDERRLDRQRLITLSLQALERDFAPFRAGWFSRFHEALKPAPEERSAHTDTYLALVSSKTPATVSFALKALAEIEKTGSLSPESMIEGLAPALAAREKGTATAALRLLERAAKREPALAGRAAFVAADALIHPAVDVQSRALDVIEKAGDHSDRDLCDMLAARLEDVAPSLRSRLATLLPQHESAQKQVPAAGHRADTESLERRAAALDPRWASLAGVDNAVTDLRAGTLSAPSLRLNPLEIPRLDPAQQMEPIQDVDALIDLFASVIENSGAPDDVERVMDGVSRLCGSRPADLERRASSLRKRAREKVGLDRGGQQVGGAANIISRLAVAWIDRIVVHSAPSEHTLFSFFEQRAMEIACRVALGEAAPLLSAPTHSGGWIDPRVAVNRFRSKSGRPVSRRAPSGGFLGMLRSLGSDLAKGDGPDRFDVIQALLRIAPDHRSEALKMAEAVPGETGAALRYALGGNGIAIGNDAALWVAAARARNPLADHPDIERRFPGLGPGAGLAARVTLQWKPDADGKHSHAELFCEPRQPRRIPLDMPTVMHYSWRQSPHDWRVWLVWSDLAIVSRICPMDRSAWIAMGTYVISGNVNWWEARWDDRAYIELLADPDTSFGDYGQDMLAFGLAAKEPGQAGAAADVLIAVIADGRITADVLGDALARASRLKDLVISRWGRTLTDTARISPLHAAVVCTAIEKLIAAQPARKPAEMVALLELEYELCSQTGIPMTDPNAVVWLGGIEGAGKAAKLARSLREFKGTADAALRESASEQLRNRIDRAERWQRIWSASAPATD